MKTRMLFEGEEEEERKPVTLWHLHIILCKHSFNFLHFQLKFIL